jgi:hypothetical protein
MLKRTILVAYCLLVGTTALAQIPLPSRCTDVLNRSGAQSINCISIEDIASLGQCWSAGTSALARLVREANFETDSDRLNALVTAASVQDRAILTSAMQLAATPGATRRARIAGLRIVVHQATETRSGEFVISRRNFTGGPEAYTNPQDHCGIFGTGAPLPQAKTRVAAFGASLSRDQDPVIRNLGRCLDLTMGPPPEERLTAKDILLRPWCSLGFKVQTASPRRVVLTWSVLGTRSTGLVQLDSGEVRRLNVPERGTLVVSYKGRELARAPMVDTPCR